MARTLASTGMVVVLAALTAGGMNQKNAMPPATGTQQLGNFPVVEFRRYTINPGEREHFAEYFDTYFPEAFEQLGVIVAGSFFERDKPLGFTWIRGFHSNEERALANAEFYYGPLWREHRATMNSMIADSNNVMLLHSLRADRDISVLTTVDPVKEPQGASGVVVAQIFSVKPDSEQEFSERAESEFARYRAAGSCRFAAMDRFWSGWACCRTTKLSRLSSPRSRNKRSRNFSPPAYCATLRNWLCSIRRIDRVCAG
jgi:hypothetical protein